MKLGLRLKRKSSFTLISNEHMAYFGAECGVVGSIEVLASIGTY